MANIDQLLQRNEDFAASGAHEEASIIARHQVCVITCLDPRAGPSAFPGLEPGAAMVVRNAGGRVSASMLNDLACTGYLTRTLVPGGPRWEVAVVPRPPAFGGRRHFAAEARSGGHDPRGRTRA